jgi:hypothetical protein
MMQQLPAHKMPLLLYWLYKQFYQQPLMHLISLGIFLHTVERRKYHLLDNSS